MRVLETSTKLRGRATDIYLQVATTGGQLRFFLFTDRNVYPDELIVEWLNEIKAAAAWYLCGDSEESLAGKL